MTTQRGTLVWKLAKFLKNRTFKLHTKGLKGESFLASKVLSVYLNNYWLSGGFAVMLVTKVISEIINSNSETFAIIAEVLIESWIVAVTYYVFFYPAHLFTVTIIVGARVRKSLISTTTDSSFVKSAPGSRTFLFGAKLRKFLFRETIFVEKFAPSLVSPKSGFKEGFINNIPACIFEDRQIEVGPWKLMINCRGGHYIIVKDRAFPMRARGATCSLVFESHSLYFGAFIIFSSVGLDIRSG